MKLVAWIAAKALDMPIEGEGYTDDFDDYYERAIRYSNQRLEKLVKATKVKGERCR